MWQKYIRNFSYCAKSDKTKSFNSLKARKFWHWFPKHKIFVSLFILLHVCPLKNTLQKQERKKHFPWSELKQFKNKNLQPTVIFDRIFEMEWIISELKCFHFFGKFSKSTQDYYVRKKLLILSALILCTYCVT